MRRDLARWIGASLALSLSAAALLHALRVPRPAGSARAQVMIDAADQDGDGCLSAAEYGAVASPDLPFDLVDLDGDARLEAREVVLVLVAVDPLCLIRLPGGMLPDMFFPLGLARVPDAGEAAGAQASAPVGHPTQGPQRDPSCQRLADNLLAAGQRLEKSGLADPVSAGERELAVGHQGCSPEDRAIQALFARYAVAYQAAGLPLPGDIFPGGS